MSQKIYILSQRCGTEMNDPVVYPTEKEANQEADSIMKEVLQDAYTEHTGKSTKLSLKKLEKWAEDNGYGDSRYFWDGDNEAVEVRVTEHEI